MNDLMTGSFALHRDQTQSAEAPPSSHSGGDGHNLDRFFQDVEAIKLALVGMESLYTQLHACNEKSKTLHYATAVKDLRSRMDAHIAASLKKSKLIKLRLEALDRSNSASRSVPGCGPGSSSDRTRTSVGNGLRKKLHEIMTRFNDLRQKMGSEYRETVQRRYFTVTGENPDEKMLDDLIETGESESFLQKAIEQQGRGEVLETIMEIQERHDAVKEMERNLRELHQVFLDMAVLVQSQGQQLDDIESQVTRANSFVMGATQQLGNARRYQNSSRKWACYGVVVVLIIVLIAVLSVSPWKL